MVRFLQGYAVARGYQFQADMHNNVRIIKGQGYNALPAVAAHIDTVQPLRLVTIHQEGNIVTAKGEDGKQAGFGADNKTGVFACLEALERLDDVAALFFAKEEVGMQGAYGVAAEWMSDIGYVIEFDCPSRYMLSYTCGGVRLFENKGAFITTAWPVLRQHGYTHWQKHPYTDVKALRKRFTISCLNLASGYHNWHGDDEFIDVTELQAAIDLGVALIADLGWKRYFCPLGKEGDTLDGDESLCPAEGLKIVTHQ